MSKWKTTVITFEEFTDLEFKAPSAFYLRNSLGEYVCFHTRDRAVHRAGLMKFTELVSTILMEAKWVKHQSHSRQSEELTAAQEPDRGQLNERVKEDTYQRLKEG